MQSSDAANAQLREDLGAMEARCIELENAMELLQVRVKPS